MLCTYDVMKHSSSLKYLPGPARGIKGYPSPRTTPTYAPHWRCYPTPQSIATNTIAGVPNPSTTKLFLKPLKVKFINTPVRIWPSLISLSKNLIPRGSARRRKCLVSATLLVLVVCWGSVWASVLLVWPKSPIIVSYASFYSAAKSEPCLRKLRFKRKSEGPAQYITDLRQLLQVRKFQKYFHNW